MTPFKAAAAPRAATGVVVSVGFNEGTADSVGCLWNSNVLIAEEEPSGPA